MSISIGVDADCNDDAVGGDWWFGKFKADRQCLSGPEGGKMRRVLGSTGPRGNLDNFGKTGKLGHFPWLRCLSRANRERWWPNLKHVQTTHSGIKAGLKCRCITFFLFSSAFWNLWFKAEMLAPPRENLQNLISRLRFFLICPVPTDHQEERVWKAFHLTLCIVCD